MAVIDECKEDPKKNKELILKAEKFANEKLMPLYKRPVSTTDPLFYEVVKELHDMLGLEVKNESCR